MTVMTTVMPRDSRDWTVDDLASLPDDGLVLFAPIDWRPDAHTSLQPDLLVTNADAVDAPNLTTVLPLVVPYPVGVTPARLVQP